jgi:hypothetical protein
MNLRRSWRDRQLGVLAASGALLLAAAAAVADPPPLDRATQLAQSGHPNAFEEYVSQPYVYLLKEVHTHVEPGKTRETTREIIAVTSLEGRSQGTRQFVLPEYVTLRRVVCATLAPNNVRIPMPKSDLRRKELGHLVEYTILLPSVAAGSILEFCYDLEFDWGIRYDEFVAGAEVPVLHARYTLESEPGFDPTVVLDHCPPGVRTERHAEGTPWKDHALSRFDFYGVPATSRELFAPPPASQAPVVVMYRSGRRNWNDMALVEEPFFRRSCDLSDDDAGKKLVQSLISKCTTDASKVAAIVGFVRREIHILDNPNDVGLYPQLATETLQGRVGVSRDAAALAIGMFRLAGVPTRMALVRRVTTGDWRGQAFVAGQFDRFLPCVLLWDKWHWMDIACRECGIDDLDWRLRGTKGLLFQSDIGKDIDKFFHEGRDREVIERQILNARWVDIVDVGTADEWEEPEQTEFMKLQLAPSGNLTGEIELRLSGSAKLEARGRLREAEEESRHVWCQQLLTRRIAAADLREMSFEGLEPDLSRPGSEDTLRVHIRFDAAGVGPLNGSTSLRCCFFAEPVRDILPDSKRVQPLWRPQSEGTLVHIRLHLPAGFTILKPPPPQEILGDWLQYKSAFSVVDGEVHYSRLAVTRRATLPPEQLAALHAEYRRISAIESANLEIAGSGTNPH